MYNAKLANNLRNLLNRVVVLALKIWWKLDWKKIVNSQVLDEENLNNYLSSVFKEKIKNFYFNYNLKWVLDESFYLLDKLNDFTTQKEPWKMIKDEAKLEEVKEILYTVAEWLRQVGLALYPFFPEKMWEMFLKLGLDDYQKSLENWKLKDLVDKNETFFIKNKWEPLFLRLDT